MRRGIQKFRQSFAITLLSLGFLVSTVACQQSEEPSQPKVTSVDHTVVKRQSIGNCWLYAQATWQESLMLTQSGEEVDVSESYWTWWHWYDQIVDSHIGEIRTGGWWWRGNEILSEHGWVTEEEFIPAEAEAEMSMMQLQALTTINAELQEGGRLATRDLRTPEMVRLVLDEAFGTNMAEAESMSRSAEETLIGGTVEEPITLANALDSSHEAGWRSAYFPRVWGEGAEASEWVQERRQQTLVRVMKALNDHQPVVMRVMIDFNALDITDQTFKASAVEAAGGPGRQGGHLVVLHDYVVDDVPGIGRIEEGDVSDEMKELALQGTLVHLKAKNSWGANRPDRGLTDGYTRFDNAYLMQPLEWTREGSSSSWYSSMDQFVLPPGY